MEQFHEYILHKHEIDLKKLFYDNKNRPVIKGITIDSDKTYFKDDGINLFQRKGYYILQVSVIDVPEYIKMGSELDKKASLLLEETADEYLFPKEVKKDCLNLNYNVKRLSYTLELKLNNQAELQSKRLYESKFINQREYCYSEVDKILSNGDENVYLSTLSYIATKMYENKNGRTKKLVAEDIIQEIMKFANEQIALFCTENDIPAIYKRKGHDVEKKYATDTNIKYTTFTSPMRKYVDLVILRQIKSYRLGLRNINKPIVYDYTKTELQSICNNLNRGREFNHTLKKDIKDIVLKLEPHTQFINDRIIYKMNTGDIETYLLFFTIFSLEFDEIRQEVFDNLKYNNLVVNWEDKLLLFLRIHIRLDLYIENKYDKKDNQKKRYQDFKKNITHLSLNIGEKRFYLKGQKKEHEEYSYKVLRDMYKKLYIYIHKNKIDIFMDYRKYFKSGGLISSLFFCILSYYQYNS